MTTLKELRALAPCIEWSAARDPHGYGRVRVGKRVLRAHRLAWENAYGPISEGGEK